MTSSDTYASLDNPEFQKRVFLQAYEQTCAVLDDPNLNVFQALISNLQGRNGALNQIVAAHAKMGKAECKQGCAACCHQMVFCTPFEALQIARYIIDKQANRLEEIKGRLQTQSHLELSPDARYGKDKPCSLLQDNSCSVYDVRPSICRTHLSTSRAKCDAALESGAGEVPYIADPSMIGVLFQLGIDHALHKRLGLNTEKVELSRALHIALTDFEKTAMEWVQGGDPFTDCHVTREGYPSNREMTEMTAKRFGVE